MNSSQAIVPQLDVYCICLLEVSVDYPFSLFPPIFWRICLQAINLQMRCKELERVSLTINSFTLIILGCDVGLRTDMINMQLCRM